jgi:antitoxin ParD1/3/4
MNVSLTDELEAWVQTRVESGLYRTGSEVVREAIRLLRERDELKDLRREELRALVRAGLDDADAGNTVPFGADLLDHVKKRGRDRLNHG